jgi:hypothetical protein
VAAQLVASREALSYTELVIELLCKARNEVSGISKFVSRFVCNMSDGSGQEI